jgi:hypothetical protein
MKSSTVDTVTGWDSGPFTDGHAGLRELADREFTGAVTNGAAWLFMLNGRVIGVFDGNIDSFEDASGTRYEAPHASLPLLYTMQETGGETRAKYYSEKTPLSEVDATLKGGKFTGYVELSENVLSGDYYTVYQGGKSMSVAFVGNNRRMLTGDEAFQRADDEVGIYEVKTVDIDVVAIPDPEPESSEDGSSDATSAGAAGAAGAGTVGAATGTDSNAPDTADEANPDAAPGQGGVTFGGEDPLADDGPASASTDPLAESDSAPAGPVGESSETTADATPEPAAEDDSPTRPAGAEDPLADDDPLAEAEPPVDDTASSGRPTQDPLADSTPEEQPPAQSGSGASQEREEPTSKQSDRVEQPETTAEDDATVDHHQRPRPDVPSKPSAFDDEATWRESRTIPALDPENTSAPESASANGAAGAARQPKTSAQSQNVDRDRQQSGSQSAPGQGGRAQPRKRLQETEAAADELRSERDRLAARVEELEAERERLSESDVQHEQELQRLRQQRDEATEQVKKLESTVADLEATIETLEAQLADAQADQADTASKQSVSPDRAFQGTNLFVRYSRKGGATLDDAFDGSASREEVNENLRLEHHTDFDADETVVEDQTYDDWLESTVEYGFSRWLVTEFIHDVRETRNQSSLEALYQAIPDVDRIEFHGTVDVPTFEGESERFTFDVVLRDRMGDPLVVANLNDSREPATESMVDSLVESAAPVGEAEPTLAGAFFVTTSYFEPGALETAHDATGGGLLRRERRKSFVKLSRKEGYHLCLVETRNGEFHVNVPEL